MMPSVPSEPDEQAGQVVAGRRLARPPRRLHHRAVGHHGREVQDVVAHGAVAHGCGAGCARGGHAADGGFLGARIDGEEETHVAQIIVQFLARDAGLHDAVQIALVHGQDLAHLLEIERESPVRRIDMPFQRGPRPERNDGHAMCRGQLDDVADLLGRAWPYDRIGRLVRQPGHGVGVLAPDGLSGLYALAEALLQDGNGSGEIRSDQLWTGGRCHHVLL